MNVHVVVATDIGELICTERSVNTNCAGEELDLKMISMKFEIVRAAFTFY
jgi:hypothetical protein